MIHSRRAFFRETLAVAAMAASSGLTFGYDLATGKVSLLD